MDLVSVIMPAKSIEESILPSVKSILNQSYFNLELLIIGKHNLRNEKSDLFDDYRVNVINTDKNISSALNIGIEASKGRYIMRMDSDDLCHSKRLEFQLKVLLNHKVDVVGCNINYIDKDNKFLLKKVFPEMDKDIKFYMPINVSIPHPTMLTYKEILLKVGLYNESLSKAEDMELFLRMINKGVKFYNVQEYLYSYRVKKELWDVDSVNNSVSYSLGSSYINNKLNSIPNQNNGENYLIKALLEYYKGDMSIARKYFRKYLYVYPKEKSNIRRYLILSVFPGKYMRILRKLKIPQKINFITHKVFGKDFQYQVRR
ncbi:MAG: glycosyltransferase [Ignavibacteria bacterium]